MSAKNFTYELHIDAEIAGLSNKLQQIQKSMSSLTASGKLPEVEKAFSNIERAIDRLKNKAAAPITTEAAFGSFQKEIVSITTFVNGLSNTLDKIKQGSENSKLELLDATQLQLIKGAETALAAFGTACEEASKKSNELEAAEKKQAIAKAELIKITEKLANSQSKLDYKGDLLDAAKKEEEAIKKQLSTLKKFYDTKKVYAAEGVSDTRSAIVSNGEEFNFRKSKNAASSVAGDLGLDISTTEKLEQVIQQLSTSLAEQEKTVSRLQSSYDSTERSVKNQTDTLELAKKTFSDSSEEVEKLTLAFEKVKSTKTQSAFNELRIAAQKLGIAVNDIPIEYTEANFALLESRCINLRENGLAQIDDAADEASQSISNMGEAANQTSQKIDGAKSEFSQLHDTANQAQAFTNRIKDFVGIAGAAKLMSRALRDAFNTVKQLDSAMTEMAVVTDTDISGYWDQLPQYTQRANEMGLAIKNVYQADTLFYQQGLKTEEVIALSTQTMKMARVAGLDTAEATDRMTAALRGFNMELNETNAQKIADVYSELAAITASDVDEISSAMTKTASIAASAGMEFETTAAFLSQIIETTRESAETAGTALKTVIARFQELKKDPAEIGEVDGEIVDANKIETALRSVGVALRDANGQFRNLDEVFMELASKWDTLDTNTQRYIATIAAGSRQQSRFIAMMSDYNRTQQLVSSANNSAGASNEQFQKTMESLEAKLNKLSNAWDEFVMGFLNSDMVKGFIDALTELLTVLNRVAQGFGDYTQIISRIGLVFAVFKTGKVLYEKFALGLVQKFTDAGKAAGRGFEEGIREARMEAESTQAAEQEKKKATKRSEANDDQQTTEKSGGVFNNFATSRATWVEGKKEVAEGQAAITTATEAKATAQGRIDTGVTKIGEEFKKKMTDITGSEKAAEAAWNKYAASVRQGGKTAKAAIDSMNQELEEAAERAEQIEETDTDGPSLGYDKNAKSLKGWKEGLKDITAGTRESKEADKQLVDAQEQVQSGEDKLAQASADRAEAMGQLGTNLQNAGMAMIGVGAAAGMVGGMLESMGVEGAAEAFGTFGTVMTVVGTITSAVGGIFGVINSIMPLMTAQSGILTAAKGAESGGWIASGISALFAQACMWPVLVITLAIIAAIIVLVATIAILVAVFKHIQSQTPEAKLAAAEDAANKAADAADRAAESYNKLVEAFDDLDDKYKSLEELTKGTREWRDAVKEINKEVLSLIEEYPELASLVKNQDGVLSIDINSVEAQAVLDQYEEQSYLANSAALGAKMAASHAKDAVDRKNLSNAATVENEGLKTLGDIASVAMMYTGYITSVMGPVGAGAGAGTFAAGAAIQAANQAIYEKDKRQTDALAEAMGKGLIVQGPEGGWSVTEGSEEELEKLGLAGDEAVRLANSLKEGASELQKYGETLSARRAQEEAMMEAMAQNAATMATDGMTGEDSQYVYNYADASFQEKELTKAKEELANMTQEQFESNYGDMAKELYGETADFDKNGNIVYTVDGEEVSIPKEAFMEQVAASEATANAAQALKSLPGVVDKLSKSNSEIRNLFKDSSGTSATMSQLQDIKKYASSNAKANDEIKTLWGKLSDEEQKAMGGYEEFKDYIQTAADGAMKEGELLKTSFEALGKTIPQWEMTLGSGQMIAEQLVKIAGRVSNSQLDIIYDELNEKLQTMNDDQQKIFTAALSTLDMSDAADWAKLPATLREMGLELDDLSYDVYDFIKVLQEASNALLQLTTDQVVKISDSLTDVLNQISLGETEITVDEDTYKTLIAGDASLAKDFMYTSDGFKYVGNSMDALTATIINNTNVLEGETEEEVKNAMTAINVFDSIISDTAENVALGKEYSATVGKVNQYKGQAAAANQAREDERSTVLGTIGRGIGIDVGSEYKAEANAAQANADFYQKEANKLSAYSQYTDYKEIDGTNFSKMNKDQLTDIMSDLIAGGFDIEAYTANLGTGKKITKNTDLSKFDEGTLATILSSIYSFREDRDYYLERSNETEAERLGRAVSARKTDSVANLQSAYLNSAGRILLSGEDEQIYRLATAEKASALGMDAKLVEAFRQGELDNVQLLDFFKNLKLYDKANTIKTVEEVSQAQEYESLWRQQQKIIKVTQARSEAEKLYNDCLEDSSKTIKETAQAQYAYLEALKQENGEQQNFIKAAKADSKTIYDSLQASLGQDINLSDYLNFDADTGAVSITEKYDELTGIFKETFDSYYQVLSDNEESIKEAEEAIDDNTKTQKDVIKSAKSTTADFYNDVRDALVQKRQDEIDALKEINESINETQSNLLESVREQIDLDRRAREKQKRGEEIQDTEQQLAYLQMDTSGGNALQIKELQKQLADQKEQYQDNLVDQALQDAQRANEEAARQREQQIINQEAQLELYRDSAEIWMEVEALLAAALSSGDFESSELGKLMASTGGVAAQNYLDSEAWWSKFKESMVSYAITTGQYVPEVTDDPINEIMTDTEQPEISTIDWATVDWTTVDWSLPEWQTLDWADIPQEYQSLASTSYGAYAMANTDWSQIYSDIDWSSIYSDIIDWESILSGWGDYYDNHKYATGGLADFTGPAWLDGTKAHPELILNARDTQNFIQLKDILSEVMNRSTGSTNNNTKTGDTYVDIEISVDSLENDYDVEQLADKIRNMLYEDSTYRNVRMIDQST